MVKPQNTIGIILNLPCFTKKNGDDKTANINRIINRKGIIRNIFI